VLAARYRLLYYHQRGCGLSSHPVKAFSGSNQYANMRALHQKLGLPAQVADIERVRRLLGVDRLILLATPSGPTSRPSTPPNSRSACARW
jgi:proline iminopeptidase